MASSLLKNGTVVVKDPPIARKLFNEVGPWSFVWVIVRVYLGWEWISAGWHKVSGGWGGAELRGYWERAVVVPETGRAAISYDWYRSFLQFLMDTNSETWMSVIIKWGEILVGVGLILGALVGIAAFFGAVMNMNFMLAGSASTNPILFMLAVLLIMAWKTAGWWGLDRWLLPWLGTPWSKVRIEGGGGPQGRP